MGCTHSKVSDSDTAAGPNHCFPGHWLAGGGRLLPLPGSKRAQNELRVITERLPEKHFHPVSDFLCIFCMVLRGSAEPGSAATQSVERRRTSPSSPTSAFHQFESRSSFPTLLRREENVVDEIHDVCPETKTSHLDFRAAATYLGRPFVSHVLPKCSVSYFCEGAPKKTGILFSCFTHIPLCVCVCVL